LHCLRRRAWRRVRGMALTRRSFLLNAGSAYAIALLGDVSLGRLAEARGLLGETPPGGSVGRALAAAKKAGASYADVRIVRRRTESLSTREDHVTNVGYTENYGLGVRVLAGGAWGFAAH